MGSPNPKYKSWQGLYTVEYGKYNAAYKYAEDVEVVEITSEQHYWQADMNRQALFRLRADAEAYAEELKEDFKDRGQHY
jgi:hypothetical protein